MDILSENFRSILSTISAGSLDEDKAKEILASMTKDDYDIMINFFEENELEGISTELKQQTIELLKNIRNQF